MYVSYIYVNSYIYLCIHIYICIMHIWHFIHIRRYHFSDARTRCCHTYVSMSCQHFYTYMYMTYYVYIMHLWHFIQVRRHHNSVARTTSCHTYVMHELRTFPYVYDILYVYRTYMAFYTYTTLSYQWCTNWMLSVGAPLVYVVCVFKGMHV